MQNPISTDQILVFMKDPRRMSVDDASTCSLNFADHMGANSMLGLLQHNRNESKKSLMPASPLLRRIHCQGS